MEGAVFYLANRGVYYLIINKLLELHHKKKQNIKNKIYFSLGSVK